jgi:lipopolysaccharide transport system permease protein
MNAAILAFIFGRVAKLPSSFLTCFAAMLCWQLFSQIVAKSGASMIGNSQLVSKVYFPRLILPLSAAASCLIDAAVSFVVMLVLLAMYRVNPGARLMLVPVWVMLTLMLSLGIGFFTSALTVHYRDVNYVMPVLLQVLMLASPVGYSLDVVLKNVPPVLRVIYLLNPLASILEAFRWSIVGGVAMPWGNLVYSVIVCLTVFVAGAMTFRRMERRFADVI